MIRLQFIDEKVSEDALLDGDLKWVRNEDNGTVIEVNITGRYKGDDETIVYMIPYYLNDDLPSEYRILWDESDY